MITSIMLVCYNRLPLTQRMMANLFSNTDSSFRLIIVDNGSTDGTPKWLQTISMHASPHCQGVELLFNPENRGIAVGRNQGLKIADEHNDEWLSTMDNDVEVPNGWLTECVDIIQANKNFSIGVNMEDVQYPLIKQNGKTFQHKPIGNLGSACMVFNRTLHQKIGFFTTEYEKYGEEDSDWGFRSRLAGYQTGYIGRVGNHFGIGELDTGEYRQFKDECRSKNIAKFQQNCYAYMRKEKPIYIPYQ